MLEKRERKRKRKKERKKDGRGGRGRGKKGKNIWQRQDSKIGKKETERGVTGRRPMLFSPLRFLINPSLVG